MATRLKYPHQDTTTWSLPKEKWASIPGFEGYYEASDFGRVRSVDRHIPHPRLKQQFVKGRVLSQSIAYNKNLIAKKKMVDLRVSLMKDGHQYYFNTKRLIVSTFIAELDYKKDLLVILNNDNDGFNCRLKNLSIATNSDKVKRTFERKRIVNYLQVADRSKWKRPYGGASRAKPVIQKHGSRTVARYPSIRAAAAKNSFDEKSIINVAKGRRKLYNGYGWEYAVSLK